MWSVTNSKRQSPRLLTCEWCWWFHCKKHCKWLTALLCLCFRQPVSYVKLMEVQDIDMMAHKEVPIYPSADLAGHLLCHLPLYPSTPLHTYPSTRPSTHLPIYIFAHLPIYPSTHHQPTLLPVYPAIYLSTNLPIYPSTHLPIFPAIYLSTHLPIYLAIYPSTHHQSTNLPLYPSTHLPFYSSDIIVPGWVIHTVF